MATFSVYDTNTGQTRIVTDAEKKKSKAGASLQQVVEGGKKKVVFKGGADLSSKI